MENQEATSIATSPHPHGFFSLKWKALLSTTLVLVTVTVTISLRNYFNLHVQFDRYRQQAQHGYNRSVQALIEQSLLHLRQLAGLIPSLPGMERALVDGDVNRIRDSFDAQLPVLQVDWGIDLLGFYDKSNRLLTRWDAGLTKWAVIPWDGGMDQRTRVWVARVNATDHPVEAISCDPDCMQYAAVPILANGQSVGVVLVGSLLADVVNSFREIAGSDIGVMVIGEAALLSADTARIIPQWDAAVVAITRSRDLDVPPERNLDILKKVAESTALSAAISGARATMGQNSYEVSLSPLPEYVGGGPSYVVVIADISEMLDQIRKATQEIVIVGSVGWLLSECLLLAILWTPMSRLRLIAKHLPLLASRQFQAVRVAILGQSRYRPFNDEIDILDDTAIALADRLEQLEEKVEERTRALSKRMEELALERDFVANLLNSAQVMIITQDVKGNIVMANPFAVSLTGYRDEELTGQDFIELLFPDGGGLDLRRLLKHELSSNRREHLRHESLVVCKDGSIRNVTWYHSRLVTRSEKDPVVLSVGLDITERRGAELRLNWMADHDNLTGLLNRRRFQEELELAVAASRRQERIGAVLLIDLDRFKYINDTNGHQSGDALLQAVASALVENVVAADVVARLGGDEFAILVRNTDAKGAIQIATTINDVMSSVSLSVGGQTLRASASIGIALFPAHADSVSDLMASADLAMYQAKEEGRGHWHMFSEDDETLKRIRSRVYWKDRVSQALAEDRFVLYYQPIMEIVTGNICHYEVLLRIRNDGGGIIGAAHFIDAAERGGIVHALDRMVVSKALRVLGRVNRQGWNVAFSINLSGHVFSDPQMLLHVRRELDVNGVDPAKVIFEITETAAVLDFAVASNLMLSIKELGCRFALDDFGIGFASFYYLKRLPVDYLKIDGSFIRQLPDSAEDQIIVRAMSEAARGFGKVTVAEYVENEKTLNLLREYGIDYAQGYLVSRPLGMEEAFRESGEFQRLL